MRKTKKGGRRDGCRKTKKRQRGRGWLEDKVRNWFNGQLKMVCSPSSIHMKVMTAQCTYTYCHALTICCELQSK